AAPRPYSAASRCHSVGVVKSATSRGDVRHADYHHRHRSRQNCISGSRCRFGWRDDYSQTSQTGRSAFVCVVEPCLIGMEACATSHYWARELTKFGHTVKLMPPAYVKPYVICGRPPMASVFWCFERFGRLRSYVRPVCAEHISAGLDEVRLPGSLSSARALRS